jgi:hypothetical protein
MNLCQVAVTATIIENPPNSLYRRTSLIRNSGVNHFSLNYRKFEILRVWIIEVIVNGIRIMEAQRLEIQYTHQFIFQQAWFWFSIRISEAYGGPGLNYGG